MSDPATSRRGTLAGIPCFYSGHAILCSLMMLLVLCLFGCEGEKYRYEDFTPSDSSMDSAQFDSDHQVCQKEKDKHLNKIQGREFGFKGSETGYLGCMKLRGWDKKNPS